MWEVLGCLVFKSSKATTLCPISTHSQCKHALGPIIKSTQWNCKILLTYICKTLDDTWGIEFWGLLTKDGRMWLRSRRICQHVYMHLYVILYSTGVGFYLFFVVCWWTWTQRWPRYFLYNNEEEIKRFRGVGKWEGIFLCSIHSLNSWLWPQGLPELCIEKFIGEENPSLLGNVCRVSSLWT